MTTTKVYITEISNMCFLNFFNSKEVFSVKGFDTVRKAKNYANKCGYELFESKPEHIADFEYCD
jgi:hypothetical protein